MGKLYRIKSEENDIMAIKSHLLTDRQRAVLATMRMHLTERIAMAYLKGEGFEMSLSTLYREKRRLEKMKLKRLYHIAQIGFQDQHLETIDQYELGFKMMWQNALRETDPYKQNAMIRDILLLKPYLSSYYEATKLIIEKQENPVEPLETPEEQEQFEPSRIPTPTRPNPTPEPTGSEADLNRKF
jgi:hypothetical protein